MDYLTSMSCSEYLKNYDTHPCDQIKIFIAFSQRSRNGHPSEIFNKSGGDPGIGCNSFFSNLQDWQYMKVILLYMDVVDYRKFHQ